MVRKGLVASVALLVAFHAWLFAGQILSGELASPALLLQWTVAGALTFALWRLRQSGESIVWSRKAVAIWLLAALLHAPAMTDRLDGPGAQALPEVVATVSTAAAAIVALGVLFLVLAGALRARRAEQPAFRLLVPARKTRPSAYGTRLLLAPRPPPLA